MNRACGNEEYIARVHLHTIKKWLEARLRYGSDILLASDIEVLEAEVDSSTWLAVYDIPRLGLAEAIVALHSEFIIGMHLHRELVVAVEILNQEGKLLTITLEVLLADKFTHIYLDNLIEIVALEHAIGNDRNVTLNR